MAFAFAVPSQDAIVGRDSPQKYNRSSFDVVVQCHSQGLLEMQSAFTPGPCKSAQIGEGRESEVTPLITTLDPEPHRQTFV